MKSLLKMISDRDQSHSQAGTLQEEEGVEQHQEGKVGGFLRFSSVDTLLSGELTRYEIV